MNHLCLLAERSVFRELGSGFREKREHFDVSDLFCWFLLLIGVFAVIALVARILAGHDKHRLYNSPRGLFRALCRAHELDRSQCRLLWRLANASGLQQPARLFLEPACFEDRNLPTQFAGQKAALAAIATRLYAR